MALGPDRQSSSRPPVNDDHCISTWKPKNIPTMIKSFRITGATGDNGSNSILRLGRIAAGTTHTSLSMEYACGYWLSCPDSASDQIPLELDLILSGSVKASDVLMKIDLSRTLCHKRCMEMLSSTLNYMVTRNWPNVWTYQPSSDAIVASSLAHVTCTYS